MKKSLSFIIFLIFVFETCSSSPNTDLQPRLAACTLVPQTVRIPAGNDNSKRYSINFVETKRCVGSCSNNVSDSCQPIIGTTRYYTVKVEELRGPMLIPVEDEIFSVEEHEECMCQRKPRNIDYLTSEAGLDHHKPQIAKCSLESRTVKINVGNDTSKRYFPSFVKINRCGGRCSHSSSFFCQPLDKVIKNYRVKVAELAGAKWIPARDELVSVEEHLPCGCHRKPRRQHSRPLSFEQTIHEFLRVSEDPDDESIREDDEASEKISSRYASDAELGRAKPAEFTECQLESFTYKFGNGDDDVVYDPPGVPIKRCAASCERDNGICNIAKETINYKVEATKMRGVEILDSWMMTIPVEEHTSCGCQCDIQPEHCRDDQIYNWFSCICEDKCSNIADARECKKSEHKVWDSKRCTCRCEFGFRLKKKDSKCHFQFFPHIFYSADDYANLTKTKYERK